MNCQERLCFADDLYEGRCMYVSLTQAKRNLEKLIELASRGEEIIIGRWAKPMVRQPIPATKPEYNLVRRIPGRLKGES
jgi:hypothetical protein